MGGLERFDEDLCLVHGVRSDTTSHPDGLGMLVRGSVHARPHQIDMELGKLLKGDAPLPNLPLITPDGEVVFREDEKPTYAELRNEAHRAQIAALGASEKQAEMLGMVTKASGAMEAFLHEAAVDAAELDEKFEGFLGTHFRMAFQAIRGNWARSVSLASRGLYFDSHSDHVRFQQERVPSTFADLATFVELLKGTRNKYGSLFDQTTVVVYSELGRFPRFNGEQGKDHWPENSWVLTGKGVNRGATVGASDDRHVGVPIDFVNGKAKQDGGRHVFIDHAFAALVKLAGGDPTKLGYGKDMVLEAMLES